MALQGRSSDHRAGTDDECQRSHTISRDITCMRYVVLSINHYAETVVLDVKHVYQGLPRLLSLWFDFTAIKNYLKTDRSREPPSASRVAGGDKLACKYICERSRSGPTLIVEILTASAFVVHSVLVAKPRRSKLLHGN
jgi:hypothetical protein